MIEIRSFRRVFDLERRIYRVDHLRLNPAGVPVRGVVYFLVLLAASLLAARIPPFSLLARELPWYLRVLLAPALSAAALTMVRVEGRPFHLAAHALARHRATPRRLVGLDRGCPARALWRPEQLLLLPDGTEARVRSLRYRGPGAVRVGVAHVREDGADRRLGTLGRGWASRRPTLVVRALDAGAERQPSEVIVLARGSQLLTRPTRRKA